MKTILPSGTIVYGKFQYCGRFKHRFARIHKTIRRTAHTEIKNDVLDVSQYRYWDAITIYDQYILPEWRRSVSAKQVEAFAVETKVSLLVAAIRREFIRALGAKWRRVFKQCDPNALETPRQAWQIL